MSVEFSKFNIKLLVLLIFPVFRNLERFTTYLCITEDNSIFDAFRYFLCRIFSAIFLFISYYNNKKKLIYNDQRKFLVGNEAKYQNVHLFDSQNNPFVEKKKKNEKNKKIKSSFFLIGLSLNILFCFLYRTLFYEQVEDFEYEKQSMLIFFDLGLLIILSYLILKQKLYKHHFYSMVTMGIVLLILFIITIKYIVIGKEFFISAIYFFFYSFFLVFMMS